MTSGRITWTAVQTVVLTFILLVLFAGVVHLASGDPGQAFENAGVAGVLGGVLVIGHAVRQRIDHHREVEGLRRRFDEEVAKERAEVEAWYAEQEQLARLEAYRQANWEHHVPTAEAKAHQEDRRRLLDEYNREIERRSNRGFSQYMTGGDVSQARIQAAAAKQFSIVADQIGANYSTLAQRQRDMILRPMEGAVKVESWGVMEPVRVDRPWLAQDPTSGELGYSG